MLTSVVTTSQSIDILAQLSTEIQVSVPEQNGNWYILGIRLSAD